MHISINWQYYFYTSECKYARFDPARIYFFSHPQGLSLQLVKILYNIHLFYTIEFCRWEFGFFPLSYRKYSYLGLLNGTKYANFFFKFLYISDLHRFYVIM